MAGRGPLKNGRNAGADLDNSQSTIELDGRGDVFGGRGDRAAHARGVGAGNRDRSTGVIQGCGRIGLRIVFANHSLGVGRVRWNHVRHRHEL